MYSKHKIPSPAFRHFHNTWWTNVSRTSLGFGLKDRDIVSTQQHRKCSNYMGENKPLTCRTNEINIQMLSKKLYEQVFGHQMENGEKINRQGDKMESIKKHLSRHGLWGRKSTIVPDVDFTLPKLHGANIAEHMFNLGRQQVEDYVKLANLLLDKTFSIPPKPKQWASTPGWTKYDPQTGKQEKVDFPDDNILVFDIEMLVPEGNYPTMATAVSNKHWYSWCSDLVFKDRYRWKNQPDMSDLIPLESSLSTTGQSGGKGPKRLVIGHNVGFDRSFVKDQYYVKKSELRFLDTMSLHIAVCGQTTYQRLLYQATFKASNRKEVREHTERTRNMQIDDEWKSISSPNNLNDVYKLHCGGEDLKKETRDIFVKGTMQDVRSNFQELMEYCADDVVATTNVFQKVFPEFKERFPHPVTLAGMLEMGTTYLPINQNWNRYIDQANTVYNDHHRELNLLLMRLADEACQLLENGEYKSDPWLWDLDWKVTNMRMNKAKTKKKDKKKENESIEDIIEKTYATKDRIPKRPVHAPGYPNWYRALCPKWSSPEWTAGPSLITTQTRITPKLMRLTWDGYPVHYSEKYGWGYLVPDPKKAKKDLKDIDCVVLEGEDQTPQFPAEAVFEMCGVTCPDGLGHPVTVSDFEDRMKSAMDAASVDVGWEERARHMDSAKIQRERRPWVIRDREYKMDVEPKKDEKIPGCHFICIPHKDGKQFRVGNPLAKEYISKIESGTLKAMAGTDAERILVLSKMCSYWKNNVSRIGSQMSVGLAKDDLPKTVTSHGDYNENSFYGAILPRIIQAGTITRRAVEKTWLTASNAYPDRIGSELKAMVQTPPGYKFVGADVDSQELWIAAVIGDSYAKIHGCTAFGWMTLQGNKSDKTDLHSKTAETIGISRDHAKIINYGRIYGAGRTFAQRLLMQFNHRLTTEEASQKANIMYNATKGKRKKVMIEDENGELHYKFIWRDGSESEMFNRLEKVATSENPTTPVLGCSISKALEPQSVGDDFMTSRVNWVVQSSAVDYLHLMLVCMRWLIEEYDIDARFSISIHDEVRYLVSDKDRYRAALALQITNLLTRAMFAYKLGMKDLPQSVAFFSAVDIDSCMRKEIGMDCKTPSNPQGVDKGCGLPPGEALDIFAILEKTNGGQLTPQSGGSVHKQLDMTEDTDKIRAAV